jgi:hypothetical protein
MARPRTPKIEKLLNALRKSPMTHKQIVKFLLKQAGIKAYNDTTRKYFDPTLYGTYDTNGVLYRFCDQDDAGRWFVGKKTRIVAPFRTAWWRDAGYEADPGY